MTRHVAEQPVLSVSIELASEWLPHFQAAGAMHVALCEAVEHAVTTLMTGLGVPGRAGVAVSDQAARAGTILRVLIDGRPIRYPDEALLLTYAYVTERLLEPEVTLATIVQSVKKWCESEVADMAVEFVCGACLEIVRLQPAALMGPAHVKAYAAALADVRPGSSTSTATDMELTTLLGGLLEMGISVANVVAVAEILTSESKPDGPPGLLLEKLIEVMRAGDVEIQLPRALLQQITTRWQKDGLELFPALRDGLFVELGIELPPLRFVAIESLKPNCFAFKVNDVASLPFRVLDSDRCLINETAERARLENLEASPATNPATGQSGSMIDLPAQSKAESLGLTTWNQLQYLVLCLAEYLRRHAWRTVHHGGVTDQLKTAERYSPSLISTFRSRHPDEELTTVVRALIRDRVSVQNLRVILEQWLDYDILRGANSTTEVGRDAVLASPGAFVRVGLGREIAHKAARSTNTVVVYLVDPNIERLASRTSDWQVGEHGNDILQALRAELVYLPPTALVPNILTFVEARATLQRLVASEFPRMSVIAHEELPPGINVQPVARISLPS